jgi:hypothetical protein
MSDEPPIDSVRPTRSEMLTAEYTEAVARSLPAVDDVTAVVEPPSDCRCATPLRNQFVRGVCDRCQRMIPAVEPPSNSRWGADVEMSLRIPADIFDDLVFAAMRRNRTVHRSGPTAPADVIRHILHEWAHGHVE